ncbi:Chitin synthase, class 3, partial [Rhizopus stolonifer]
KDMTYLIRSKPNSTWIPEADCLAKTIAVGQIDTLSVGCMFSEIVLYVSLVVILGVILAKFLLAVYFGWFMSWKLGNFKEESSYAARMRREEQIENWTRDINDNGPVVSVPAPPPPPSSQKKHRTLFPRTSRFTPLEYGSTRFDFEKPPIPAWRSNANTGSRPNSVMSFSTPSFSNNNNYRGSTASFSNYVTPGISSFSWDGRSSVSNNSGATPSLLPLILLALILGLPAVLIGMTSRKLVYVGWMLIYLVSLVIWNFVLPTYAFWHFDDFSWGDTRKVEGVSKDKGHGDEGGQFDSSVITMKKWSEYEIDRRTKLAQENHMPVPRFQERHMNVDIFTERNTATDTENVVRRYSDLSSA